MVPILVQLELAKWLARETDEMRADQASAYTQKCLVVPMDTSVALRAAECCRDHRLAMADAIVYATALELGADVLTCDARFAKLPGVVYLPKPG